MPYGYQKRLGPTYLKVFRDAPDEFILEVNHIISISVGSFFSSGQTLHLILFFKLVYIAGFPVPSKAFFTFWFGANLC